MSQHETVHVADIDPAERDELSQVAEKAERVGGYLHVEVRKVETAEV